MTEKVNEICENTDKAVSSLKKLNENLESSIDNYD